MRRRDLRSRVDRQQNMLRYLHAELPRAKAALESAAQKMHQAERTILYLQGENRRLSEELRSHKGLADSAKATLQKGPALRGTGKVDEYSHPPASEPDGNVDDSISSRTKS